MGIGSWWPQSHGIKVSRVILLFKTVSFIYTVVNGYVHTNLFPKCINIIVRTYILIITNFIMIVYVYTASINEKAFQLTLCYVYRGFAEAYPMLFTIQLR